MADSIVNSGGCRELRRCLIDDPGGLFPFDCIALAVGNQSDFFSLVEGATQFERYAARFDQVQAEGRDQTALCVRAISASTGAPVASSAARAASCMA